MAFIDWSPALSVGFEEIDSDHRKLIDLVNRLSDAVSNEADMSVSGEIIEELISYTSWHFRHEERLMQNFGDPELLNHKQEHLNLLEQVSEIKQRFDNGDKGVPEEMLPFLKEWLTHHILETDMKTGHFLADKDA